MANATLVLRFLVVSVEPLIAVLTPENLETSLKVSTFVISFDKCKPVGRCQMFVSTKSNTPFRK